MRMAPRSPAVESFLRNFERERVRLQEVLEVTLCYGVFCLSQNFSLKGMSVEELRAVTKYEAIKKRDFFVRNAGISARRGHADGLELSTAAQQLRVKPSHSWRDGNDDADILTPTSYDSQDGSHAETPAATANRFLSETHVSAAEKKQFDEIDFFTQLFGKQFIDTAWATFAGRNGSQIALKSELDERFTRIDQRKLADKFPALELPVASFVEFLSGYVKICVGHHHQSTGKDNELEAGLERSIVRQQESDAVRSAVRSRQQRPVMVPEISPPADVLRPRSGRMSKKPPASDHKAFRPKSLQHVQSKIKPELDARREKLLRVRTTQTQLMKERLARTRLAEYEAKRMLDAAADRSRGNGGGEAQRVRKMPLADITTGAAALEIADDFMKSPLLDSFSGKENRDDGNRANIVSSRKDPLREELYGAAPLDDSFLGCKPPRAANAPVQPKLQPKKPSRAYNGWLGDFGPQHTKTVVSEWGTPADEGEEEDSDDAREAATRMGQGRRPSSSSQKFEWKFDGIDMRASTRRENSKTSQRKPTGDDDFSSVYSGEASRLSHRDDDAVAFSDAGQSDASDPVFKWLKRAV